MLTRRNVCLGMFAALLAGFVLVPTARAADDATGTWKWSVPGRNGGAARDVTLKLKQDGEKLTGTLNFGGNRDVEITDGKIKDGELSFKVVQKRQNNEITTNYTGKLSGDTIKGKSEREGGNGQARDWEAKRSKE
jgi:hypothetical protein